MTKEVSQIYNKDKTHSHFIIKNDLNIKRLATALTLQDVYIISQIFDYQRKIASKLTKAENKSTHDINHKEKIYSRLIKQAGGGQVIRKEGRESLLEGNWWSEEEDEESFYPGSTRIFDQGEKEEEKPLNFRRQSLLSKQSEKRRARAPGKETFLTSITIDENSPYQVIEKEIQKKQDINEYTVSSKDIQAVRIILCRGMLEIINRLSWIEIRKESKLRC